MVLACGAHRFSLARFNASVTEWAKLETSGVGHATLAQFVDARFARNVVGAHSAARIFDAAFINECPALGAAFAVPLHVAADLRRAWDAEAAHESITHPSLFACPAGVKSGLHIDSGENSFWMVLLEGRKRYRFVHAEHMHLLKTEAVDDCSYNHYVLDLFDNAENCDAGDARAASCRSWRRRWSASALAAVRGWETEITRGDMIFVPHGQPHQVQTLSDTISFSANFVEPELAHHTLKHCCLHANALDGVGEADCARALAPLGCVGGGGDFFDGHFPRCELLVDDRDFILSCLDCNSNRTTAELAELSAVYRAHLYQTYATPIVEAPATVLNSEVGAAAAAVAGDASADVTAAASAAAVPPPPLMHVPVRAYLDQAVDLKRHLGVHSVLRMFRARDGRPIRADVRAACAAAGYP